jgi:hypothetical protein
MQKGSTTNTILVLLLVVVVGFVVWYATMRHEEQKQDTSGLNINIGGDSDARE